MREYDYTAPGLYFITLCTHRRAPLFGTIARGIVRLTPVGELVQKLWSETAKVRPGVALDAYIVMPDHLHAILSLPYAERHERQQSVLLRRARSLGSLVAGFKSACTSRIHALLGTKGVKIWQRNYYERVIRDQRSLERIRGYIAMNPALVDGGADAAHG